MALQAETILDRRRLRRHLSFWRLLAIAAIALAIGALAYTRGGAVGFGEKQIARVTIDGMITESRAQLHLLDRVGKAKNVAGVILYVNSPGGTTTGGEALFESLRRLAGKKPVVAQFGTVAASAAYMAGIAADHIVARGNTITGSVGVIMQWPEVSGLLDKLGIKMNELKSGPLKANPSPFQPLDEAGKKLAESMIAESSTWFLNLVRLRRQINPPDVPGLEQGRIFSGREALTYKLIDEIGGETEARQWLEEKGKVEKGLKVVDWKPSSNVEWPFTGALAEIAGRLFGRWGAQIAAALTQDTTLRGLSLDGLVSVWQPPGTN